MSRQLRMTHWPVLTLVVGCVVAAAHTISIHPVLDVAHGLVQNGATVSFAVVAAVALRRSTGRARITWSLIALFGLALMVAQLDWTASGFESGPTGAGLWSDNLYVAALPLGICGLVSLAFSDLRAGQHLRVLTDALVVAAGLGLLQWTAFFAEPVRHGAFNGRLLSLAFPFLDVVAAAVIITASIYQPHRASLRWLAGVISVSALADTLVALHVTPGGGTLAGGVLLVMWFAGPMLLTIAAARDAIQHSDYPVQGERRQLVNLFVYIGIAGIAWAGLRDGRLDRAMIAMAVMLGLSQVINQRSVFRELRDLLTAHTDALEALTASELELRLAFDGAPVGIVVLEDGVLRSANQNAVRMLQLDEHVGRVARDFIPTSVLPQFGDDDWVRVSPTLVVYDTEIQWPVADGPALWIHLSLARDPTARHRRVVATIEDVSERRATTERLAHLAVHDPLTGLPNRASFMTSLIDALDDPESGTLGVAFVDVDRFKVINDSVGHAGGDRMLLAVAERLRAAVGDTGIVARFAGDEFTILFKGHDRGALHDVLEEVQRSLGQPLRLANSVTTYPTASIGVGLGAPGDDAEELLAFADAAMYRAKELGRNRFQFYDGSHTASAPTELRIVDELHRALEREQFRVVYQPVVSAQSGVVVGFEALLRWQHPQRGLVGPDEFVDAAEASGLIVPMGEWVLREALGQLATWRRDHPQQRLTMAVNVAAPQVTDDFPDLVARVVAETGVAADDVWIELTESTLMRDTRGAEVVLERLRHLGVHISVDDFGTGYSSLTYLQRLPVEGIKLDRSFVAGLGIEGRERDRAICQAVVSLGRALGLRTVGEGVENERQLAELTLMGCGHIQGYYFGRPQPATALTFTKGELAPAAPAWSTSDQTTATATR